MWIVVLVLLFKYAILLNCFGCVAAHKGLLSVIQCITVSWLSQCSELPNKLGCGREEFHYNVYVRNEIFFWAVHQVIPSCVPQKHFHFMVIQFFFFFSDYRSKSDFACAFCICMFFVFAAFPPAHTMLVLPV